GDLLGNALLRNNTILSSTMVSDSTNVIDVNSATVLRGDSYIDVYLLSLSTKTELEVRSDVLITTYQFSDHAAYADDEYVNAFSDSMIGLSVDVTGSLGDEALISLDHNRGFASTTVHAAINQIAATSDWIDADLAIVNAQLNAYVHPSAGSRHVIAADVVGDISGGSILNISDNDAG